MEKKRISRFGQVSIYAGKCFRLFIHEKQWKNFISTAIIMLIISLVTGDEMFSAFRDTKNGVFAVICACVWIGLFNSIQSICRERSIIKREHRTGFHLSSYVAAHVIYDGVICAVETLLITIAVYLKNFDRFPESGIFFSPLIEMYITFFLVVFGSDTIAILISSIVRKENTAMTIMPFVLIIQLVMSGAVFDLKGITEKISYLTLSKWGLDGICAIANTTDTVYMQYQLSGMETAEPEKKTLLIVWGILLLSAFVYISLSALLLRLVDKDKRS